MVSLVLGANIVREELGAARRPMSSPPTPELLADPHAADDPGRDRRARLVGQDARRVGRRRARRSASSPARRGRRRPRHGAFADEHGLRLAESLRGAARTIRRSTRSCSRRRTRCTREQVVAAAASRQARLLREAVRADQSRRRDRGRGDAKAGVTLGLGYNRRFHPEMTRLRQTDPVGRARNGPARRGDDDVPQRAVPPAGRVARAAATRRRPAD